MNDGKTTPEINQIPATSEPAPPRRNAWPAEAPMRLEGPRSRTAEFFRVLRIMREFLRGFRALHFLGPCVTVFGSARFKADHRYYGLARRIGGGGGQGGV